MARISTGRRLSYRAQQRRFAKCAAFPRWITVPFILLIGLMLWLGVASDPSGNVKTHGLGSIVYLVAVIGIATLLAYSDRDIGLDCKDRPGYKGRRVGPN